MSRRSRVLAVVAVLAVAAVVAVPASGSGTATYEVTITNLTDGQPLSPPVAVTHKRQARLFKVGTLASPAITAIAEDGNQSIAVTNLLASQQVFDLVFDVVDGGQPITPAGTTVGSFTDSLTFQITGRPGDRLSVATMLICTNDGFTGIDGMRLPNHGTRSRMLKGYDAGTENNTEASADIVDPCSALGPVGLAGDPNGNDNAGPDTVPPVAISPHPGVQGGIGELLAAHDWNGAVARLTVTRVG